MGTDTTGTYKKAKQVFSDAGLKQDVFINIDADDIGIFRKHLSEIIKRQASSKRFASRYYLDKNQLKVIRIE